MARVTVEDCLKKIPNRFELILVAAERARQLERGANSLVKEENDKYTVLAFREIAEGYINAEILEKQKNGKNFDTSIDAQNKLNAEIKEHFECQKTEIDDEDGFDIDAIDEEIDEEDGDIDEEIDEELSEEFEDDE